VTPYDAQQAKAGEFFSGFAAKWDSLYGGKRNLFWRLLDNWLRRDIQERYQLTFERLGPDLRGQTVLDIGCGSGIYCFEAARRGADRVVGIDFAEGMISLARQDCSRLGLEAACEFICGPFPPPDSSTKGLDSFDYAIVMGVMDYVADPLAFLTALRPLVRKFAVIAFNAHHWFRAPLRYYRYKLLGRCEVYTYDEEQVRGLLAKAGFDELDILRLHHSGGSYIVTAYSKQRS
jgi:2-polyprenyl-3-methyl-5-hydroxy-6-metoxy-1,4-benzoquinol methylase